MLCHTFRNHSKDDRSELNKGHDYFGKNDNNKHPHLPRRSYFVAKV